MDRRFAAWTAIFAAALSLSGPARPAAAGPFPPGASAAPPGGAALLSLAQWGGGKKGKKGKLGGKKGNRGGGGEGGGPDAETRQAFMAQSATMDAMIARGFYETGLRPRYPDGLDCQTADSFFATTTRGNGSQRSQRFYNGHHGGLDIPAKGIGIIAMAGGEVVAKSEGGNIGGIKVVLRHSPEDTGLGVWTFTEYKHLKEQSPLAVQARVGKGDVVGIAWNTGTTTGRAYGPQGHYHLHLSAWYNDTGEYHDLPKMMIPKQGRWTDPLAMMRGRPIDSASAKDLPDAEKKVRFAYKTADGAIHPEGAKVIWPFVCR